MLSRDHNQYHVKAVLPDLHIADLKFNAASEQDWHVLIKDFRSAKFRLDLSLHPEYNETVHIRIQLKFQDSKDDEVFEGSLSPDNREIVLHRPSATYTILAKADVRIVDNGNDVGDQWVRVSMINVPTYDRNCARQHMSTTYLSADHEFVEEHNFVPQQTCDFRVAMSSIEYDFTKYGAIVIGIDYMLYTSTKEYKVLRSFQRTIDGRKFDFTTIPPVTIDYTQFSGVESERTVGLFRFYIKKGNNGAIIDGEFGYQKVCKAAIYHELMKS
ncbi:hypothetical protein MIR68_004782 [Amoeboaphelidium protococcarum]|nr:hypothetical protein MIR68_004782 [Amoeboaphelidium protococcarum]